MICILKFGDLTKNCELIIFTGIVFVRIFKAYA